MKIRTQLLLACFLLSVLPLTGIVFYSYRSSRQALEDAYHHEAARLTAQMDRRLTGIRTDLDQRLAGLSAIPLGSVQGGVDNIMMAMGEAAPLVDALEFVPTPAVPRTVTVTTEAKPAKKAKPVVPAAPRPPVPQIASVAPPAIPNVTVNVDVNEDVHEGDPAGNDLDLSEPIVIDLPPVKYPKFEMPADFSRRIAVITGLSTQLGQPDVSDEEKQRLTAALKKEQDELKKEMDAARASFHVEMAQANEQRRERERVLKERRDAVLQQRLAEREQQRTEQQREKNEATLAAPAPQPAPVAQPAPPQARIVRVRTLSPEQLQLLKTKEKQAALIFGQNKFNVPLHSEGKLVGQIRAQLSTDEVIKRVLGSTNDDAAEVPFAVDREGNIYTRNQRDRDTLGRLGVTSALKEKKPLPRLPNWVVAMSFHKESGLRFGVARPVGENLEELRRTAARNFGWGVGVIALALIGILPVARHFTNDVRVVTEGAERIAHGDLMTRVPVRSKSEFGQLALAFNRMAEDLSHQQEKIVSQERERREQDIQQRILALEYERKSIELEDARRFQLSMLPKSVPQHDRYDVGAMSQTATEVGGDYYDFHLSPDGVLSVTIGDATGHGAKAGTMVTVVKTLFAGYDPSGEPAAFLGDAAEKIKRMDLGRMAMALSLAKFDGRRLTVASAGMPPLLVHRAAHDRVDEITLGATPLGTLGVEYQQTAVDLYAGDTVLMMSDGLPELQNAEGQQLGYVAAMNEFAAAAKAPDADGVIAGLAAAAKEWHGEQPPNDDITFVVVRCRA